MSHVGDQIKQARIEKGMTQIELAKALGVSKGTISRYELSSREPRYSQLCAIADALNIPVQQLAGPFPEENDTDSVETPAAEISSEERKAKKQERVLLDIFGVLSVKGQAEAVRRLSELAQLPEYRRELTLPQALSRYASRKDKIDYYVMDDVTGKETIFYDAPFGSTNKDLNIRRILLKAVTSSNELTFLYYPDPVMDEETVSHILSSHCLDDYRHPHMVAFSDAESCRLAGGCLERQYFDTDSEDIPDFAVLYVQEDEIGSWTIQEEYLFPPKS